MSLKLNPVTGKFDVVRGVNPLKAKGIQFDLANPTQPHGEGLLHWNEDNGTLEFGLPGGSVELQIGQENLVRVTNDQGSQINNGQAVYISGATGTNPYAKLANASNITAPKTLAIATENITAGQKGYVTTFGLVRDIDTSFADNEGDDVYLSTTDGGITITKLDHPNFRIKIGTVIRKHATEGIIFVNIDAEQWLKRMQAQVEPTGFDRNLPNYIGTISFDNATRTFTHTPVTDYDIRFWYKAKEFRNTENQTVQITDTSGLWFIYYSSTGVITASQTFPGFTIPLIATIYWNATMGKGLLGDERHGLTMDWSTHYYLHQTVGTRYGDGLTGTFGNTTFSMTAGSIWDEDIIHSITSQTTCDVLYKDGSSTYKWLENQTKYYYEDGGSDILYNNGETLTKVPANLYVAYWVFATNSPVRPIVSLMGQRTDVTLANAQLNNKYESLALGTLPFKEMKLLYRVILRNDATPYIETHDLRSVSNLPSGTYLATDHGTLTGLNDLDHPASAIMTDTTNFDGNLSSADDTVQKALDTIDNMSVVQAFDGGSFGDTYVDTVDFDGGSFV